MPSARSFARAWVSNVLVCRFFQRMSLPQAAGMPHLIHQCSASAVWSSAELMSDAWSVCLPHQCEANEKALFHFKQTQTDPDKQKGSIIFYSVSGSALYNSQMMLKRVHEPLEEAKRAACHAKKFVLHFEAPISLLRAIEVEPDADFIRRHFICIGSEPPIPGQSLLTFHSADTDCVFKCAAIPDVLSAKKVIQNFIERREFCFTGFNGFTGLNSSDRPRAAESKKSKPEPLSDTVASVLPSTGRTDTYRDVKLKNILILQNHKLFVGREALFMLQSDFSTVSTDQLPNLIRTESSVDLIYESACKLAVLLSDMQKRRSRVKVGTPEYMTTVYFPVIRPVILEIGLTKLTVYFCRFVLNGTVLKADAAAASISSFWDAFPLTSKVFRGHLDAMSAKSEAVAKEAWDDNFTRLGEGLENFSTLGQQLVPSDSVVSLLLVFRDEAFRRPFVLNAKHHSELCRFKESDELSLVFKFAFLVCSKHQFDGPSALTAGALERQQASSCHSTAAAASPRHLQFIVCIDGCRSVITFPHLQKGVPVGSVWKKLSRQNSISVTVAINMNPPPEEQLEDDDDNIALCSSSDEDCDF